MAEIEYAVVDILQGDGAVSALIGTRVFSMSIPQEVSTTRLPCVVYTRISRPQVTSLDGPSNLAFPRLQLNCWASTYPGAKALAKAVREALDGFSGSQSGVAIAYIEVETENDIVVEPAGADVRKRFAVAVDIICWNDQ